MLHHVVCRHIVHRINLARIANAERHTEVAQLGIFAAWHERLKRRNSVHRLLTSCHLAMRQRIGVGTVEIEVAHVEIGQVPLIRDCPPSACHCFHAVWDKACFQRFLKRLAQKGRKHVILFAAGDHFPFTTHSPVTIGLRVGLDCINEPRLVDAAHRKHDRDGHHLVDRMHMRRGPSAVGDVGISCRVYHPLGEDSFTTRLALHNHAADSVAIHNGRNT